VRIQYITQHFSTPGMNGGVRHFQTCNHLARRGHYVHLITSWREGLTSEQLPPGIRLETIRNQYSNSMSHSARMRSFAGFAAKSTCAARRESVDLVFASSTPLTVAVPGIISKQGRAPFILEVRDLWPEMPLAMGALTKRWQRGAAWKLQDLAYREADAIIALSPGMADGIAAQGVPRSKISVVPNACDLDLFQDNDGGEAFLASAPALRGMRFALFAGSLGPLYEPQWLVAVAEELAHLGRGCAIVILGEGSQKEAAVQSAREKGLLAKSIFFLSAIPRNQLPSAYAAAQVVLSVAADVPGIEHNSANKFFDGLAAGRPVAVNYGGWQGELLEREGAGWAISRSPGEAAHALFMALRDESELLSRGQNALRLAEVDFERGLLNQQIESVLLSATK